MQFRIPQLLLTFIAAVFSWSGAYGQVQWTGATDDNWGENNNWNPAGVPASNAVVVLGNEAANEAQIISLGVGQTRTISSGTGLLRITSTGSRDYTINDGTLNFLRAGTAPQINSDSGTTNLTINSNITISDDGVVTGNTILNITGSASRTISLNGNITAGTGVTNKRLNMNAANTQLRLGGTTTLQALVITSGEVVANSPTLLNGQLQGGGSNAYLSLATNTTVSVSGAATFFLGDLKLRIREDSPSSTDRILTLNGGRLNSGNSNGSLTIVENINSTGRVILNLTSSHPSAPNNLALNLGTNGLLRFSTTALAIYGGNDTGSGIISGGGDLEIVGGGTVDLRSANTYTGNTTVNLGTLLLSETGKLNFLIGADGVNNQITGLATGNVTLNGAFTFDLTGASSNFGDSWNVVDMDSLGTVTFGTSFSVDGFNQAGTLWTNGNYQFDQQSGLLSVIPEPNSLPLLGFAALAFVYMAKRQRKSVSC